MCMLNIVLGCPVLLSYDYTPCRELWRWGHYKFAIPTATELHSLSAIILILVGTFMIIG